MRIDRPYLTAWIIGAGIHVLLIVAGYRATPASGEITYEDLVPIEIVEVQPEPEPEPEPGPEPEPEPEPEPPPPEPEPEPEPVNLTESPIPTDAEEDADPEATPVFGLSEESVVDDPDAGATDGMSAPVGNTIGIEPEQGERPDTVQALAPVPFHLVTIRPRLIEVPEREYPSMLLSAGVEGRVILELIIGIDGEVREAKVVRSDHDAFSRAALRAIQRALFEPAFQGDKPVPVRIHLPIDFTLDD